MNRAFDTDVAIIGYGPSGVSAANFLGSHDVATIAFERSSAIYPRARAVTINDWTMRIYQSVGLDAALKKVMDETVALRWVTYDGRELNRVQFPPGRMGHAPSYSIYQPAMEEVLRAGAARYGQDVRYGVEVTGLVQDDEGVTLSVVDAATSTRSQVRARYALACDGGSSGVREALGVPLLGDTVETRWVVIDARVKRWWPNRHILTFWCDSIRPVVDIALALGNHRWELPLAPHETEADFATHDQLWTLLSAMGVSRDDVEIHQHAFYRHHVRHAERWRVGRVLLVGDAAHLMPPWAGQGMQSGVRDAYNLAWKLAAVLQGRLPDSLLDSFQPERAPDVERYTQISVGLGRLIKQELSEAELAAMQPSPGVAPPPSPLLAPPQLHAGWIAAPGAAVGAVLPQCRIGTPDGRLHRLDDALGNGFVVLGNGVDPRTRMAAATIAGWERLGADWRVVRSPDAHSAGTDLVDIDVAIDGWMKGHDVEVIVLRPDRFVASDDSTRCRLPDPGGAATPGGARGEAVLVDD